jgi:hypothetical protein
MSRFNLELDPTTTKRLRQIPNGFRSAAVRQFIKSMCASYEQYGEAVLGVLVSGDYELVPRFPTTGGNSPKSRSKRK